MSCIVKLGVHFHRVCSSSLPAIYKNIPAAIDKIEHGKRIQNLLVSNESAYLKHFGSIFEELWNNGIEAADRIKDVEEGIDLAEIEIIVCPREGIAGAWTAISHVFFC